MKILYLMVSIFFFAAAGAFALEEAASDALDIANIKAGCWVEYNIVIEDNPNNKLEFNCFIKLYGVAGEMLDFEYKIDGISTRVEIARKDFPLARLVPKIGRATSYKETSEERFGLKEMNNQEVVVTHDIWNYENGVTEVWHSAAVPFSVVKVACKGFTMELRAFSWTEE